MPQLQAHGDGVASYVERIDASLDWVAGPGPPALAARFRLNGDLAQLAIPAPGEARRADGLWRHTCFEFFLRPRGAAGYAEVNLAPSTEWAAYAFSAYREGMTAIDAIAPAIEVSVSPGALTLVAQLPLAALAGSPAASFEVALSAVVEANDGTLSWWALAHPDPQRPDFHHPGSFVHEIRY